MCDQRPRRCERPVTAASPCEKSALLAAPGAVNIVDLYHGEGAGEKAMAAFDAQFKKGEMPDDVAEFPVSLAAPNDEGKVYLAKLLVDVEIAKSTGEARRLIDGGGVKIDGQAVAPKSYNIDPSALKLGDTLSVGKRKGFKLI